MPAHPRNGAITDLELTPPGVPMGAPLRALGEALRSRLSQAVADLDTAAQGFRAMAAGATDDPIAQGAALSKLSDVAHRLLTLAHTVGASTPDAGNQDDLREWARLRPETRAALEQALSDAETELSR